MMNLYGAFDPWSDPFLQWISAIIGAVCFFGILAFWADWISERNTLKLAQINLQNTLAIEKITDPQLKQELLLKAMKLQKEEGDDD
jgi:hypothetical protein